MTLLGGALAGCGAPGAVTSTTEAVRFDPCASLMLVADAGLSAPAVAGVAAGIDLWNRAARTRLVLGTEVEPGSQPVAAGPAPATGAAAAPALPIHFQAAGAPFHGFYDPVEAQIFINADLDGHDRVVAVAHEVGHAFGLAHVSSGERPSVMNPGNLVEEPTAADVAALAALWGSACGAAPPLAAGGPGDAPAVAGGTAGGA